MEQQLQSQMKEMKEIRRQNDEMKKQMQRQNDDVEQRLQEEMNKQLIYTDEIDIQQGGLETASATSLDRPKLQKSHSAIV